MPPRLAQPAWIWRLNLDRHLLASSRHERRAAQGVGKPKGAIDTLEDDIPGLIKERSEKCETIKQCREA